MSNLILKKIYEKIYYNSPVFIQNILVTIYGYKLYRERYNKNAEKYFNELMRGEYLTKSEMQKSTNERFSTIARDAIENVPFYRNWARVNGVTPSDIKGLDDLELFPIITKGMLRENVNDFISDKAKDLIKLSTSGTTGSPISIFCTKDDRSYHYAFFSRLRSWFGLSKNSRRVTFFGRVIMLPEKQKPPFWRMDFAQNNLLMSSYHLSQNNLLSYYNKIKKYNPEEIIGYPSSLYEIANFIVKNGLQKITSKVVFTTAETLFKYQREVLEKAFNAPVIDQYGCTEMAFFVSQCEHGTMHIHPEHGFLETLDTNLMPVKGEAGTVLATGLVNQSMPLIRYEVGDRVILSSGDPDCECGRAFPIILGVEGRVDDVIYRRDGTPVGRLDPIFKGGSGIISAKIKQDYMGNVKLTVVPTESFGNSESLWIRKELEKRLGKDIDISIEFSQEIQKESNGKFKAVESDFKPNCN